MIIGHEAAGTVAKVGKNVTHLKVSTIFGTNACIIVVIFKQYTRFK